MTNDNYLSKRRNCLCCLSIRHKCLCHLFRQPQRLNDIISEACFDVVYVINGVKYFFDIDIDSHMVRVCLGLQFKKKN